MQTLIRLVTLFTILTSISANASNWDLQKENIVEAAYVTGVDVDLLTAVAFLESSFREHAKARAGTSKSLMGITDPTWNYLIDKYGSAFDIGKQDRTEGYAEAVMGGMYLLEIKEYMEGRLGREVSNLEVYLGYKFSPHRAVNLVRMSGKNKLVAFYPEAAERNRPVYFHNEIPRTVYEVINLFATRLENAVRSYASEARYLLALKKQEAFTPFKEAYANRDCVYVAPYKYTPLDREHCEYNLVNPTHLNVVLIPSISGRKFNDFYV